MRSPVIFDIAAVDQAFREFGDTTGRRIWTPVAHGPHQTPQKRFLALREQPVFKDAAGLLTGLQGMVSAASQPLNEFARDQGFRPAFAPISRGELGVAAIFDLTIKWTANVTPVQIPTGEGGQLYHGFGLPGSQVAILFVDGFEGPIIRIPTKDDQALILVMMDEPPDELTMVEQALKILRADGHLFPPRDGPVHIPNFHLEGQRELSWMRGLHTTNNQDKTCTIAQAWQFTRVSLKRTPGPQLIRRNDGEGRAFRVSRGFLGFIVQGLWPLPIGLFYARQEDFQAVE